MRSSWLVKGPIFREKISIASPALVEMMDIYMNTPEQLSDKKLIGSEHFNNEVSG